MSRSHEFRAVIEGDDVKNVKKLTKEQLKHMGKIIFGIFAHPDDEAFCVAGTLLKEVSEGAQVHLVCLTDGCGKHSMNPDNVPDLRETRMNEWYTAGELIGTTTQEHFGYADGQLNNDTHIEITEKIEQFVRSHSDNGTDDNQIEFITLDTNGITGHIDHIVAARSTLLAYHRLKMEGLPVTRVRLACIAQDDFSDINTGFTLREPGRPASEIDETVDASEYLDKIREVMWAHHSQRSDAEEWMRKLGDKIAINHFVVKE